MSKKIAIFSPASNAYSETFIQAHRKLNGGNVAFYFGSPSSVQLDGKGGINPFHKKIFWRCVGLVLGKKNYDITISLKRSLKRENVDGVLLEYGTHGADLFKYIKKSRIPFVVHFHGYDASSHSFVEKYKEVYKDMFKSAAAVIAVSKLMEKQLLSLDCPREKLVYNVYGPNDIFFDCQPTFESDTFLSVGRFVDKKAPYYLILSFIKVVEKHPSAKLIMIGTGNLFNTCENLVNHYGVKDNVLLIGKVSPEKIKNLMVESLCFVQHSIVATDGDTEGTPLTILEASAAGLPVLSTIHAGIPDVILHGETGLLVKEHEVDEMANNMIALIENKQYARSLGSAGKERINEYFTQKRHLDVIDELFINSRKPL